MEVDADCDRADLSSMFLYFSSGCKKGLVKYPGQLSY